MAFTGCSHVTINNGIFSAVGGNQHNNHGSGTVRNLVHLVDPSEGQSAALTEYRKLKTPDIRLKRKIANTPVKRDDLEGQRTGWGRLDARRVIYTATIEDRGEKEFLYVKYEGSNAIQAYQQDFKTFSAVKDVNWVELFGYIAYNALPALVFYDALVPVSRIFERSGFSCMLEMYLCYSATTQGVNAQTLFRELWVNPCNGTFHRGPYVADTSDIYYRVWSWSPPSGDHPSLDLQTYNNTGLLFQYLIGILPIRNIVEGIHQSNKLASEWLNNADAKLILSSLPGMIYHRTSRDIIARYRGDRERWYYYPRKERFRVSDVMRENTTVMDDGSMRFMLKLADIASVESFQLYYDLQPVGVWVSFVESWVSQAHGIFSQLGIEEAEWRDYSIFGHFHYQFERVQYEEESHTSTDIPTSTPIYLFIRPVPCPSDDENGWDVWLAGRRYYWSFDSAGKEVSEDERQRLGLPSFRTSVKLWHEWWNRDAYNATEMVNRHEGFDSKSLNLARSLGHPILEVVGGDTRFEEVDDNDKVQDAAIVTGNGGRGSVGVETPVDAQPSPTVDVHSRPRNSHSNFMKLWVQRLKAKYSGRRKQS